MSIASSPSAITSRGKYDLARVEYETLQRIAPDDPSAHYNLPLIYKRLGMFQKAADEANLYADQKNDPSANTYAVEYLRDHADVVRESIPWHVHDLDAHPPVTQASASRSR